MKKLTLISSLLVIAALALAACTTSPGIPATGSSGATTSTTAPSGGTTVTGTPSAAASPSVTGTAASASTTSTSAAPAGTAYPATTSTQSAAAGTPAVPVTGASTATMAAQTATTPAATSAAGGTAGQTTSAAPTTAATAAATGTSSANTSGGTGTGSSANQTTTPSAGTTGTQQAGVNQTQFLRLSNLMNLTVQTSDQQQVGAVSSVVVDRPTVSSSASANSSTVSATTPVVRYVVVNLNSMITSQGSNGSSSSGATGSQVIVPWQAFNFSNLAVGQGSNNQTASTSTLTLNQTMTVLTAAPRIDAAQAQNGTSSAWENQVTQYWTSQGLSIPATSTTAGQTSNLVFIGKQMDGFIVVGANNAVLGQVADFLVDVQTGAIAYAVITPQSMNGQSFFVPLSSMNWQFPVGQNSMTTLGNLVINITPSILENAPSLGSLNNLQITPELLQQLNQFWQGFQSTPVK